MIRQRTRRTVSTATAPASTRRSAAYQGSVIPDQESGPHCTSSGEVNASSTWTSAITRMKTACKATQMSTNQRVIRSRRMLRSSA